MKKFNYRITVNISHKIMKLGFRGKLSDGMEGRRVRVQAIFTQRQVDRRFPMEVTVEESELGPQIRADAVVELPYVFYYPPKHRVNVVFALWDGLTEIILEDQPFPVEKEMFARITSGNQRRNLLKFGLCSLALPVLLARNYMAEGKNMERAKRRVNNTVYHISGYNYSPRQRNTDYFAAKYNSYVAKESTLSGKKVLFLSERLLEKGGNLALIKKQLSAASEAADSQIEITEFICTETVDKLTKKELRECAKKCAQAKVIILEDFYPQLHRLTIRRETKVVQLWHACGAFKTFGLSRMGKPGGVPQSSMNHRNYDLVCVSSETVRGIYAEAFAIAANKVKALGVPRTDVLFDWEYKRAKREELYEKYPILRDHKVILFAPTFRGEGNKDAFYPEEAFDIPHFMEGFSEDIVCIIKHHPFVKQSIAIEETWKERVLNLTGKDHINDLMLVADLLITDYSSSVFEAVLLELPVLFYAFDQEEYMRDRDFYFDYTSFVPGPVEKIFEKMVEKADEMIAGQTDTALQTDQFRKAFLSALDGKSTKRISDYIRENYLSK